MKKTLTINLGGSVFHIDEDAYQLLDKYLSNLRFHFEKEEGTEEIMNDFELRISELFSEKIRLGYQVITIELVEEIIKRMGKPEEIFDDDYHEENEKETEIHDSNTKQTSTKRLMRDPDDKILGGVASGFAAYTGWDVTVIRIVLILLMFYYGIMIPIYVILWIFMPLAKTATEKLEMRGKSVTIENIGKTVTDGFDKVNSNVNEFLRSEKPRNLLQKCGDVFVQVVGIILKFLAILSIFILVPILLISIFVFVVFFIALLTGRTGLIYQYLPFTPNWYAEIPLSLQILGGISLILLFGVPIFYIGYAVSKSFFKLQPLSQTAKWTLIVLWVLSFVLAEIYSYQVNNIGIIPFFWG